MAGTVVILGPPRATLRSLVDRPLVRFLGVGVGSTGLHLGLFAAMVPVLATSQLANVVALVVATVANTAVNRRWTFGVRDASTATRHHLQALLLLVLTWAASAGALWLLHSLATRPPVLVQTVVVGASMAVSTVVRYVGMRTWIFASR
ncbi:GtrA family protein [Pedococcus sp. KACC 23699]|uniref:GtrA family protein n=1 Tax=Pedococcus sp. KACC 23699 TaxID=3149228 RepID=A0AAU7JWR0_9MICO